MKGQCRHKRPDGKKCQANATARSGICFFHDPERAADRLEAQRAGGLRNKGTSLPPDTPDCDLKNVGDVIALLGTTLSEVRRGQVDPKVANSVGYLAGILLRGLELDTLERRICDLELATKDHSQSRPPFDTEEFQFIQGPIDDQSETSEAT